MQKANIYYLVMFCYIGLTVPRETQLYAGYTCIYGSPSIITHGTPCSISAYFNTALVGKGPTSQPEVSSTTGYGEEK